MGTCGIVWNEFSKYKTFKNAHNITSYNAFTIVFILKIFEMLSI